MKDIVIVLVYVIFWFLISTLNYRRFKNPEEAFQSPSVKIVRTLMVLTGLVVAIYVANDLGYFNFQ